MEGDTSDEKIGRPESSEAICQTHLSISRRSKTCEEIVRPAWRHAEAGGNGNDLPPELRLGGNKVSVPILRGRRRVEETCP